MSTNKSQSKHKCWIREMRFNNTIWIALIYISLSDFTKVSLELEKGVDGSMEKVLNESKIYALLSDSTFSLSFGCLDRESA